jgi:hypothetical protein
MEKDYYMDNVVNQAAPQHHCSNIKHTSDTIAVRPRCSNLSPNLPSLHKNRAKSPVFVSIVISGTIDLRNSNRKTAMNREDYPAQIRLGEDGELIEGISCTHCGHISLTRSQPVNRVEHRFLSRPVLFVYAWKHCDSQRERKSPPHHNLVSGFSLLKLAIWIYIFLVLLVGILMFPARSAPLFQNACGC